MTMRKEMRQDAEADLYADIAIAEATGNFTCARQKAGVQELQCQRPCQSCIGLFGLPTVKRILGDKS